MSGDNWKEMKRRFTAGALAHNLNLARNGFVETGNAFFAWEAIHHCELAGAAYPQWVRRYLGRAAESLLAVQPARIGRNGVAPAIAKALTLQVRGGGKSPLAAYRAARKRAQVIREIDVARKADPLRRMRESVAQYEAESTGLAGAGVYLAHRKALRKSPVKARGSLDEIKSAAAARHGVKKQTVSDWYNRRGTGKRRRRNSPS